MARVRSAGKVRRLASRGLLFILFFVGLTWMRRSQQHATLVLDMELKGGFTNQVLDLVYVATLATAMKPCKLLLPALWSDGTEYYGAGRSSPTLQFNDIFDLFRTFSLFVN